MPKRMSLSILLSLPLLVSFQPRTSAQITAEGGVDCATWVMGRKENRAVVLESFLIGVLNGMSMGSRIEFWSTGGNELKREQVFLWMDNYCQRSPLKGLYAGAIEMINERTNDAWNRFQATNPYK